MLPNDSDAPFLARRGGEERHEESENGADGAFGNKAIYDFRLRLTIVISSTCGAPLINSTTSFPTEST